MKPISIRFQCFGPYVEEQYIDFRELDRVFAISGETGSGKTTILDAMCYALYGSSSSGERGEFADMRCQLAKDTEDTSVEFIFEENGNIYQFSRTYAMARSRFNETYFCGVKTPDGWAPLAANIKKGTMQEQAEAILHLNATQFRQIIILPQGKFESFLMSDSKAKETVLESIFEAAGWGDLAEKVAELAMRKDASLREKENHLKELLHRYGCETDDEMRSLKTETAEEAKSKAAEMEKKALEKAAVQKEVEEAVRVNELFNSLDAEGKTLSGLEEKKEYWAKEEQKLSRGKEAWDISGSYDGYVQADAAAKGAASELGLADDNLQTAEKKLTAANKNKQLHLAREEEQNDRIRRKTLLENARDKYESIGKLSAGWDGARRDADEAAKAEEQAKTAVMRADTVRKTACLEYNAAEQELAKALTAYRQGIAGELAAELAEDQPCPVCGSLHHPAPAVRSADHVSKETLETIEKQRNQKNARWKEAEEALETAKEALTDKERTATLAKEKLASARAELEAAKKNLVEGIEDAPALEKAIQALGEQIDLYRTRARELEDALTGAFAGKQSAADARTKAAEAADSTEEERKRAEAAWQETLAKSSFADEGDFLSCRMDPKHRDELTADLAAYKTELRNAEKRLEAQKQLCSGKQRPDIASVKEKQSIAEAEKSQLDKECDRLRERLSALEKDMAEYDSQRPRLLEERVEVESNLLFAERLRGSKGVGLKRYVLGIMMTRIVQQANGFLKNIYGGRYRLHREAAEARNRKVGLELEIEDLQTGDFRGVGSLSGGEKFLVALSLAIGLSAVVQMQGTGVHMDAMFVDEGFGSLHPKAVEDAVTILAQARGGDGVVGVITHVDQVVKSIGGGLEAVKGSHGNTLRRLSGGETV